MRDLLMVPQSGTDLKEQEQVPKGPHLCPAFNFQGLGAGVG